MTFNHFFVLIPSLLILLLVVVVGLILVTPIVQIYGKQWTQEEIQQKLGYTPEQIEALQNRFYAQYGTQSSVETSCDVDFRELYEQVFKGTLTPDWETGKMCLQYYERYGQMMEQLAMEFPLVREKLHNFYEIYKVPLESLEKEQEPQQQEPEEQAESK